MTKPKPKAKSQRPKAKEERPTPVDNYFSVAKIFLCDAGVAQW